jgi:hypothetical protein
MDKLIDMRTEIQRERKLRWEREIQYLNEKLEGCELDNISYRVMILKELQTAHKGLLNVIELELESEEIQSIYKIAGIDFKLPNFNIR